MKSVESKNEQPVSGTDTIGTVLLVALFGFPAVVHLLAVLAA